ncbi:ABC transporter permease [Lacticaseibacillus mingshuiensis]|uniref:ABC transporter permease n=1 Tax=Lacticaseibacillus mingshuiensis TaxID=2799574 RepID=UPI001CED4092|nr:iron export ABC transporter permease subunit FetB [Lacticaseibacillus mingshuiensis]
MTNDLIVSPTALLFAVALVAIALIINFHEKIGLEKEMLVGVVRAVIQLTVVGYVLTYIIKVDRAPLTFLMMAIIIFNAALNARKRANGIPHAFAISLLAITVATGVTIVLLVLAHAVKFTPSQIVPISGMIASNAMVAIGLCYRNMNTSFHDQRQAVLERLALGATLKQASIGIVHEAIRTGMSPTIDSAKTVGLVSLPGMMSGLIFAGVDPTKAIMYQIMVTFMLLAATSLGSVIACYLAYPRYYNEDLQLR